MVELATIQSIYRVHSYQAPPAQLDDLIGGAVELILQNSSLCCLEQKLQVHIGVVGILPHEINDGLKLSVLSEIVRVQRHMYVTRQNRAT